MSPLRPVPEPESVKTLVVRATNWVGDAVMNTPFLARARMLFPNARITVLARPSVAPLFNPHPDVDEVWAIDDRSRSGYRQAVARLRQARADLAFALPNSLNSALMLALGGARHRVGYNRDGRGALLTHAIPLRPNDLAIHEVRYYLRLLRPWGVSDEAPPPLRLQVTQEENSAFTEWLGKRQIPLDRPLIGVNPAAFYGTAKRWMPERYAAVAAELGEETDARVIVTGLESERDVAQAVCDAGGPRFYNAAGEMKLRELLAFQQLAVLFLTNDSGAMHMACAVGTPTVAIFGSTDWVTTAPLSPVARVVRRETPCAPCILRDCPIDHRCMTAVTVNQVLEVAQSLLQKN